MPTGPRPCRRPFPALLLAVLALGLLSCRGASPPPNQKRAASPASRDPRTLELVFTYGSEKEAWIRETTEAYNRQGRKTRKGKRIAVTAVPMGSGEAIEELLAGTRKAHLTSPASGAFIALGNAQSRARTGKDLIGPTENLVLSPVVVAMWKPMAEALGWPRASPSAVRTPRIARLVEMEGWGEIRQAAVGRVQAGPHAPPLLELGRRRARRRHVRGGRQDTRPDARRRHEGGSPPFVKQASSRPSSTTAAPPASSPRRC